MRTATPLSVVVGRRIRGLRRTRMMTQREMGAPMAATPQTVAKWETGRNVPPLDRLVALATLFDVPLDYLVGRDLEKAA